MILWRPYTKAMLSNTSLWAWAVGFMMFWLAIGAFVESQGQNLDGSGLITYSAAWYVIVVLFSLSMFAVAVANSLTYGSAALSYAFRFSRLSPSGYFASVLGGSVVMGTILSFAMLGFTLLAFGFRFETAIVPANFPALIGVSVAAGIFFMALSTTLMLVVINYLGLRNTSFVAFIPLLLSYAFGLSQVYAQLPSWLLYCSPYNEIASLLFQGFTGRAAPVEIAGATPQILEWPYLALGLVLWTGLLSATSALLLRRVKVRSIEEGRQI